MGKRNASVILDTGSVYNIISYKYAVTHDLLKTNCLIPTPQFLSGSEAHCYKAYQVLFQITDSWGCTRTSGILFYTIEEDGYNLLLGGPGLKQEGIVINKNTDEWRYRINPVRLKVEEPKRFSKNLRGERAVYAVVLSGFAISQRQRSDILVLPSELKEFEDVFFNEGAGTLPTLKEGDHAIDLDRGEPSFGP